MSFKILFYQEKGSFPVQEYMQSLDEAQQNKIFAALKRLKRRVITSRGRWRTPSEAKEVNQ